MLTRHLADRLDALVFGHAYRSLSSALAAFSALALPSACVVCGRWDTSLCSGCSGSFRRATARPFRAEETAEALPDVEVAVTRRGERAGGLPGRARDDGPGPAGGNVHGHPDDPLYLPLPVVAAGRYGRAVSTVMLAYKNHGHVDLTAPLAAALAGALHRALSGGALDAVPGGPVLLVPIPSRAAARRRRGYDPLGLLLAQLDRGGKLPAGTRLAPWLGHVHPVVRSAVVLRDGRAAMGGRTGRDAPATGRFTRLFGGVSTGMLAAVSASLSNRMFGGQKGAGRRRRRTNVLHTMALPRYRRKDVAGRTCVIIDDVLTTGATIGEAHRALTSAGAEVLGAVVVAATKSPSGTVPRELPEKRSLHDRHPVKPGGRLEVPERQGMNKGGA